MSYFININKNKVYKFRGNLNDDELWELYYLGYLKISVLALLILKLKKIFKHERN